MTNILRSPLAPRPAPTHKPMGPQPQPTAPEPTRGPPQGHSARSGFVSVPQRAPVSLNGGAAPASSLRTERLGDGTANCLEEATRLAHPGDSVVLLSDNDGVGHALVQHPDGSITDPNHPHQRFENLAQWQSLNPRYHSPVTLPDAQVEQVLRTPPGPARDALIQRLGLSAVADRRVAEGGTQTLSLNVTFEPQPLDFTQGRLGGSITSGPYSGMEVTLSWDASRPDPNGRYQVTVELTSEVGVMNGSELGVGPFGVEGATSSGVSGSRSYTLNLTRDEVERLQRGQYPLPSIVDPLALPVGTQVMMSAETFGAAEVGLSFGPLSVGEGALASAGYSYGVERLEGNTVRITVGPTTALERNLSLGLGFELGPVEVGAELGRSHERSSAALTSVELDLDTEEGRLAYQEFLRTRTLPADGPGVSHRTTSQVLSSQEALEAGLQLGPFGGSASLWTQSAQLVRTTGPDGLVREQFNAEVAPTGNRLEFSYRYENGQPVLESVGFDVQALDGTRTRITLEGQQGIDSLRDIAWSTAQANLLNGMPNVGTPDEVREWLRTHNGGEFAALALQPGEAGFSHEAWAQAYSQLEMSPYSPPQLPTLTRAFIGNAGQEGLGGSTELDLLYRMGGALQAFPLDQARNIEPLDNGSGTFLRTWYDFGLVGADGITLGP